MVLYYHLYPMIAGFFVCKLKKVSNDVINKPVDQDSQEEEGDEEEKQQHIGGESFKSHILEDTVISTQQKKRKKQKTKELTQDGDEGKEIHSSKSELPDTGEADKKKKRVRGIYKKALQELQAEMEEKKKLKPKSTKRSKKAKKQ